MVASTFNSLYFAQSAAKPTLIKPILNFRSKYFTFGLFRAKFNTILPFTLFTFWFIDKCTSYTFILISSIFSFLCTYMTYMHSFTFIPHMYIFFFFLTWTFFFLYLTYFLFIPVIFFFLFLTCKFVFLYLKCTVFFLYLKCTVFLSKQNSWKPISFLFLKPPFLVQLC